MGVGSFGIIHKGHSPGAVHHLPAMPRHLKGGKGFRDCMWLNALRPRHGGRGQRIQLTRRSCGGNTLCGRDDHVVAKSIVHDHSVHDADLPARRGAQRKANGIVASEVRVVDTHHRDIAKQHFGLVSTIVVKTPVPVNVVVGQVKQAASGRADGAGPVELEAGELHHQNVIVTGQGVAHSNADVAHRDSVHHGGEHGSGGGFSVGSSHRQPGAGRAEHAAAIEPPAQFHVADDGDALVRGVDKQRGGGPPAG